jgi:signal transduction histidine kinase
VESIGLQKPENLLLAAGLDRAADPVRNVLVGLPAPIAACFLVQPTTAQAKEVRRVQVTARRDTPIWLVTRAFCTHAKLTVLSILLCVLTCSTAAPQPKTKNVLVVFSGSNRGNYEVFDLIESSVRARAPGQSNFYSTSLNHQQLEDKSYCESLAETLRREYREVRLDVVIASGTQALEFTMQYRDKIFPGVPIVFTAVNESELEGRKMLPGMTGVPVPVGLRETIDLALHLHPDANAVAVIQDTPGSTERHWLAVTHAELLRHQDKVREIDLIGPPSDQMLERIAALPSHTVVLFQLAPQSSNEPAVGAYDVLIAAARRLPTYSAWPSLCLYYGCIGGAYPDWRKQMRSVGEVTARVLSGDRPEKIPIVHSSGLQVRVDWRQLQRWHIPESRLPPGSVVEFKPPSAWHQYKWEIVATLGLLALESLLIAVLLVNRRRRRRAEGSLKELTGRVLRLQDEERRRMARDLHDGTAQDLNAISLCLSQVLEDRDGDQNGTRRLLEEAHSLSRKALQEVRSVSYALHPPILDETGLVPALRWYLDGLMKRTSLRIVFDAPAGMGPLPPEIEGTLFRIVQESIANILNHSGADGVRVHLERDSNSVRMSIEDNGRGMGGEALASVDGGAPLGVGIAGMRERVQQFRGKFEIRSGSEGTTVLVSVPVSREQTNNLQPQRYKETENQWPVGSHGQL